jgi:NhaP-type Na+/H+ or K+/H+ antiporter
MESYELLIILIGIILVAGVSRRIQGTIISLPMLYTLFGLLAGLLFKEQITITYESPIVETIATITLLFILASDASRIRFKDLISFNDLPFRLLIIGLPLTIITGALVAAGMLRELGTWGAVVLAVILTPTDASLGESVVEDERVPARIRQALNVESGLNDGIALPFLMLAIALAVSEDIGLGSGGFLKLTGRQIIFGTLVGIAVGFLGAHFIGRGVRSGWMSNVYAKITSLALVLITYGLAELFEGNGFIAAFVFGITLGNILSKEEGNELYQFARVENTFLMLVTYILFGMVMLAPALKYFNWSIIIYAIISLTVVRMLPVAISMIGTKLKPASTMFMGWFGPRGIASILYVLTVMSTERLNGKDIIFNVVILTVFLSILLHGISAAPLSKKYGEYIAALDRQGLANVEMREVEEVPTRKGLETP